MPDLVAEVAEQRAIRLVHDGAPLLALGVVGLFERKRNQSVIVTGHHPRPAELRLGLPRNRTPGARRHFPVALIERQIELHQRIEQPMLGHFDLLPGDETILVAGVGEVRLCRHAAQ